METHGEVELISMTTKEQILREMDAVPEPLLAEVLDFLQFLKAKHTQQTKRVTVVSASEEVSMPLSALAEREPHLAEYITATPLPMSRVHDELNQALADNGYHSREQIVDLVQEVKQEMLAEELIK